MHKTGCTNTTFATKSGDSSEADFPVSTGRYPEHAGPQEEGKPRVGDHLREEAPILRRQPVALYEPMEHGDEVLPATICGM